jgi:flagellar hook-length control protein FliK
VPINVNAPPLHASETPKPRAAGRAATDDKPSDADANAGADAGSFADALATAAHVKAPVADAGNVRRRDPRNDEPAKAATTAATDAATSWLPLWALPGAALAAPPLAVTAGGGTVAESVTDRAIGDVAAALSPTSARLPSRDLRAATSSADVSASAPAEKRASNDEDGTRALQAAGAREAPGAGMAFAALSEHVPAAPAGHDADESTPSRISMSTTAPDAMPFAAATAAPQASDSGSVPAFRVLHPVGSAGWANEVAERLVDVVRLSHESAELRLQPAHLGPIDIRVTIAGDQASIQLVASHALTREALENALPMLRELLAQQGLALADTAVDSRPRDPPPRSNPGREAAADAVAAAEAPAALRALSWRLVDTFA